MNNNTINTCIADLFDNYSHADLIYYATSDDGAYTIQDHGTDFDVNVISDALEIILARLT